MTNPTATAPDAPLTTVEPAGTPRGGVVVIQEAFGITSYIEDVLARFASAGWVATAPHQFHRSGDPVLSYDDLASAKPLMGALTSSGIDEDVDAALSALAEAGFEPSQCAVVGFCMGGTVTTQTAVRRKLGAAVAFYGGGVAQGRFGYPAQLEVAEDLQTPWLGLFGDLDQSIPTDQVEELREKAARAVVRTEVVRYPNGKHGYHCDARPAVFDADSATDAWRRALEWLDEHVARP